jgi:hypothetical protein
MTEIKSSSEFTTPPATPTAAFAATSESGLRDSELRKLLAALTRGDEALARRKDLTELHKRVVAMFTTLNQGLVDTQLNKALEDRAQLVERLDQIERSVNSMEGALRIELEPLLKSIVTGAIEKSESGSPRNRANSAMIWVSLCAALILGAYFSAEIAAVFNQVLSALGWVQAENGGVSSLNGGSAVMTNLMG